MSFDDRAGIYCDHGACPVALTDYRNRQLATAMARHLGWACSREKGIARHLCPAHRPAPKSTAGEKRRLLGKLGATQLAHGDEPEAVRASQDRALKNDLRGDCPDCEAA